MRTSHLTNQPTARRLLGLGAALIPLMLPAPTTATPWFQNITPTRGIGGERPVDNRYIWSSEGEFKDGHLYVGTFSVDFNLLALERYIEQIENSGQFAPLDAFRRLWSGSPLTDSRGGEIWRYKKFWGWERVYKADPEIVGFRSMTAFKHLICAGYANGPNGPQSEDDFYLSTFPGQGNQNNPDIPGATVLYEGNGANVLCSSNGKDWSVAYDPTNEGPGSDVYNASIRAMAVAEDKYGNHQLLVGTENPITGPKLYAYDGSSWSLKADLPPGGLAVGEVTYSDGITLLGTWATGDGFQVLQLMDDGTLEDRTPILDDGSADGKVGVMELRFFNGYWYVGALDYENGFLLTRTQTLEDRYSWEVITSTGFKTEFPDKVPAINPYPWSSIVKDGVYLIGTFTTPDTSALGSSGGLLDLLIADNSPQLWYSTDGASWDKLSSDALSTANTYGFRTMTHWKDKVVIGTASNFFIPSNPLDLTLQRALEDYFASWGGGVQGYLPSTSEFVPQPRVGGEVWTLYGDIAPKYVWSEPWEQQQSCFPFCGDY